MLISLGGDSHETPPTLHVMSHSNSNMMLTGLRSRSVSLQWREGRRPRKGSFYSTVSSELASGYGNKKPEDLCSTFSSELSLCYGNKKEEVEKLWREVFANPSEWRDHRLVKTNPSFPDFRHKKVKHKALWLDSKWNPPWVEEKLAATDSWTLESTISSESALGHGDKNLEVEKLWLELFSDPAEWRDHRPVKADPRFPDFRHKKHMRKALWLDSRWIPPWVEENLATLPPGSIQLSTFSRNQLVSRYVQAGRCDKIMELFQQIQRNGNADGFTFFPVLKACTNLGLLRLGRHLHTMMPQGLETDICIGSTLVDMYAKCGSIEEAEMVYKQMPTRDVITLNAMIGGYVKCGEGQKALELFEQMQVQGMDPDRVTFVRVLNACGSVAALKAGRRVHEEIIRKRYGSDIVVGTSLVDMYAKCGSIEEAETVFNQMSKRDVVAWNAMIGGYVNCGEVQKAVELFDNMQRQVVDPDRVTFVGIVNACASVAALETGRRAHEEIVRRGYESDVVIGNCLVDMYCKCGSIGEAHRVFNEMPTTDVVTFTAMIRGYTKCGEGQKALELFEQMQGQGVNPDPYTFVEVLSACASLAALEVGRNVHEEIIHRGYGSDLVVGNCLVDMYAKCGSIEDSERVFNQMPARNVVTWTTLLAGYGIHGYTRRALKTFKEMCKVVEVNGVTFLSLLSACSHGGLVAEGLEYFKSMSSVYNTTPTVDHFACVVDLLSRAGLLGEAEDLIMNMPMNPNTTVWMTLLSACRAHVNVEVGERCAKQVLKLEPHNSAVYVLLSNIYIAAGKFDSSGKLYAESVFRGVKKILVRSWIEINTQVHSFTVDDNVHPQMIKIHAELERLSRKMKAFGYIPDTRFVLDTTSLQCVNEEENKFHLCHHSEKLAIAFGLISTRPGTPLQIVKNVQLCSNCHASTKFIAMMVGREITVRDADQFHHFQDGLCSCRDDC